MSTDHSSQEETWASGAAYEAYVGRWSRRVAREFLIWLKVPLGSRWLDVGCGTGALSQIILDLAEPSHVTSIDRSLEQVTFARDHISDERAQFAVGDAQTLAVESRTYQAVVSGLVLNFIPDPQRAATEMVRVVKSAGAVAVYVWDYAGEMQFLRHFWNAAAALEPSAHDLDEGRRFPLCRPDPLRDLFENAGLQHVEVRPIDIATDFQDFDDYWQPFLGGQGPAPGYVRSLNNNQREALRERIKSELPFAPDGSISLVARAWAVRGQRQ
ncbi:MAG TPA: methyltransferase domain-containing protein [Anaerolineae bacterium]|nr:methyltransferase domain-containing protein [Anaerolineae bacterium]